MRGRARLEAGERGHVPGGEAAGRERIDDRRRHRQPEAARQLPMEVDRLAHRELLGGGHEADERRGGIGEPPPDRAKALGHRTDAGERTERLRGGEQRQRVPRGGRIDDDKVVDEAAEPAGVEPRGEPVQHEELGQARGGGGEHLEARALEQPTGEHAQLKHAQHEVGERRLGLDRRRREVRAERPRLGAERPSEQRPEPARTHLDREHTPPRFGRGAGERRRDGALADTALARDDHQTLGGERETGGHDGGS
jgi:hypothetical protein